MDMNYIKLCLEHIRFFPEIEAKLSEEARRKVRLELIKLDTMVTEYMGELSEEEEVAFLEQVENEIVHEYDTYCEYEYENKDIYTMDDEELPIELKGMNRRREVRSNVLQGIQRKRQVNLRYLGKRRYPHTRMLFAHQIAGDDIMQMIDKVDEIPNSVQEEAAKAGRLVVPFGELTNIAQVEYLCSKPGKITKIPTRWEVLAGIKRRGREKDIDWNSDSISEENLIKALGEEPKIIWEISEPSEEMWITALRKQPTLNGSCKNKTDRIQMALVENDLYWIKDIENPCDDVVLKLLESEEYKTVVVDERGGIKIQYGWIDTRDGRGGKAPFEYYNPNPSETMQVVAVNSVSVDKTNLSCMYSKRGDDRATIKAKASTGCEIKDASVLCREAQLALIGATYATYNINQLDDDVQIIAIQDQPNLIGQIKKPSEELVRVAFDAGASAESLKGKSDRFAFLAGVKEMPKPKQNGGEPDELVTAFSQVLQEHTSADGIGEKD